MRGLLTLWLGKGAQIWLATELTASILALGELVATLPATVAARAGLGAPWVVLGLVLAAPTACWLTWKALGLPRELYRQARAAPTGTRRPVARP